jgi:hypothetical protein
MNKVHATLEAKAGAELAAKAKRQRADEDKTFQILKKAKIARKAAPGAKGGRTPLYLYFSKEETDFMFPPNRTMILPKLPKKSRTVAEAVASGSGTAAEVIVSGSGTAARNAYSAEAFAAFNAKNNFGPGASVGAVAGVSGSSPENYNYALYNTFDAACNALYSASDERDALTEHEILIPSEAKANDGNKKK